MRTIEFMKVEFNTDMTEDNIKDILKKNFPALRSFFLRWLLNTLTDIVKNLLSKLKWDM